MSKIDWSKAPEGTTHHHPQTELITEHWFKEGFFCNVGFEMYGWQKDICPLENAKYAEKPTEETLVIAELCSFSPSRDDFALAALPAMIERFALEAAQLNCASQAEVFEAIARSTYALADAMLAERAK